MDGTKILILMNTSLGADVDWMADPCSMRTCPIQLSVRALRIPKEPPVSVADALPLFQEWLSGLTSEDQCFHWASPKMTFLWPR